MIASQRRSVISNGFSTMTCLPARAAATAGSVWASLGVPMVTTATRRIGQHVVQRVIRRAAGLRGQLVGGRGHLVETGDELGPANVADRLGVKGEIMPQPIMPKPSMVGTPGVVYSGHFSRMAHSVARSDVGWAERSESPPSSTTKRRTLVGLAALGPPYHW